MGVYVKGMAMPKNCLSCVLRFGCDYALGEYDIGYNSLKPNECPLIEIPDKLFEVPGNSMALKKPLIDQHTMCKKRCKDKCNEYCDGYMFWEECYEPS